MNVKKILQFSFRLQQKPRSVWRRIQVPITYTFFDLHIAIIDCMSWKQNQMFEFQVSHLGYNGMKVVSVPTKWSEAEFPRGDYTAWEIKLTDIFKKNGVKVFYIYATLFSTHKFEFKFEGVFSAVSSYAYPRFLQGKGNYTHEGFYTAGNIKNKIIFSDTNQRLKEFISHWRT